MKRTLLSMAVAGLLLSGNQAFAAEGTGRATMRVVAAISITSVSDLIFSEAAAGSAAETVDAGAAETDQNASFAIIGEPNRAINITLPADGVVTMTTAGGGSPDTEVAVGTFSSNAPTAIDASGTTELFVGATRAALTATQAAGEYEGNFIVDVVYQ